jgi:single-stranded-DNA-specific exonuclease
LEKWFIRNKKYDYKEIASEFEISEIVAKLLINRDIYEKKDIELFLNPQFDRLNSAELMKDLLKASDIIIQKIKDKKRIRIVGDFDVDGIMSVYILYKGLKSFGAEVDYIIPDRVIDGYGININIVNNAKEEGIDTIITCDNGIAAINQIKHAKELGMTVIVTDHHDIPYTEENNTKVYLSTDADAIINPKQLDCKYPFKNLCGAGIVYRFIRYLSDRLNLNKKDEYLEFVAIATICDVVDLVGENRIIVRKGLEALNSTKNIGLKALIDMCGVLNKEIGVYHVGFILGPTINASGRLDTALYALELLLTEDMQLAYEMAKNLRDLNDDRRKMTIDGVDKVIDQIEAKKMQKSKVLVVYEPDIHESIAGIIAGRIKDKYNMPTIVLTKGIEGVKGSARSIEEYNMFEELSKCKDLLNRFGGHSMAAGLSLDEDNIDELRSRLNQYTILTEEDLIPKIYIDMQLPFEYINYKLINEIKILEPYGKGNSKPLFGEKNIRIKKGSLLGAKKNVLKLSLISPRGQKMEGIIFNDIQSCLEDVKSKYGEVQLNNMLNGIENNILVDILYYPEVNEYNGNVSLQVIIKNYRFN